MTTINDPKNSWALQQVFKLQLKREDELEKEDHMKEINEKETFHFLSSQGDDWIAI